MFQQKNNYAFIDSQNLNLSVRDMGWNLDFKRFRIYLLEKLIIPNRMKFSSLLRKFSEDTAFMNTLNEKLGYVNKKEA